MIRAFRFASLILAVTALSVPSARALSLGSGRTFRGDIQIDDFLGFDAASSYFHVGPAWLMNSLPGARSSARARAQYLIDRSGDGTESTAPEAEYVGTLSTPFDVSLFGNLVTFASNSGVTKTATAMPSALNASNTYSGSGTGNITSAGNWSLSHVPTITEDAVFASTSPAGIKNFGTGATVGAPLTVGSFNVTATSGSYSIRNATTGATNAIITLGGSGSLGNGVSGTASDLLFAASGSTFNILGPNGSSGSGTLNLVLGQSGNFNAAGTITVSSVISDGGSGFSITKTGAGTLTLSAANTFGGGLTLSTGSLALSLSSVVSGGVVTSGPVGTGTLALNGGTLRSDAATTAGDRTINNNLSLSGSITLGDASSTGVITFDNTGLTTKSAALTADATLTTNSAVIIADAISGAFNLTKAGASSLTLSGNNTFGSGKTFTLSAGTLNINSATALGAGTFQIDGGVIDSTATFTNQTLTNNNPLTVNGNFTFTGTNSLNLGTGSVTLGAAAGTTRSITVSANTLTTGGDISNGVTANIITKAGNGTLTLMGNNSYSGGTNLTAGTIAVGTNTALGSGPLAFSDGATLRSADANTRTLANVWTPGSGTSNTIFGSAATGDLILTDSTSFSFAGSVKTFTVNNSTTTISKGFTSSGGGNGLTKAGAGTLVLTGTSTYTGATLINAGTLEAATTGALGSGTTGTSGITVNAGGTLVLSNTGVTDRVKNTAPVALDAGTGAVSSGGKLTLGKTTDTVSTSETVGALTLNNNSTIDFASTSGSHFALTAAGTGASTLSATSANYALVLNWDGTIGQLGTTGTNDRLLFANGVTGFTDQSVTNQLLFNIGGQLYNTEFLSTGGNGLEAVPFEAVPEPSTWVGGALALAAVGFTQRRRLRGLIATRA